MIPVSIWEWRISGLTRDGMVEPLSRDQILRRERGQAKCSFFPSVQLTTSRIGNHNELMSNLLDIK